MRCLLATAGRLVAGRSLNVPTGQRWAAFFILNKN